MRLSNPKAMETIMGCKDRFSFTEVTEAFRANQVAFSASEIVFAQIVGILEYALRKYPDKTALEAYLLVATNPGDTVNISGFDGSTPCSAC